MGESKTPAPDAAREFLFSYGTLQLDAVQLATFGRLLVGKPDHLVGFEQAMLEIEDAEVVATSGETHHLIVKYTGRDSDTIAGPCFR